MLYPALKYGNEYWAINIEVEGRKGTWVGDQEGDRGFFKLAKWAVDRGFSGNSVI